MERGEKRKRSSRAESSPTTVAAKKRRRVTRLDGGVRIDQGDLQVVERIYREFRKGFESALGFRGRFVYCLKDFLSVFGFGERFLHFLQERSVPFFDLQSMIEINSKGDYRVKTIRSPGILAPEIREQLFKLPDDIRHCTNLIQLDLSYSGVAALPRSIGNIKNLEYMSLNNARTIEELPCEIGELTSLKGLDLSFTKSLAGLPEQIGNLTSLEFLGLDSFGFGRPFPTSIGDLKSLKTLDLSEFHESWSLPESLGDLNSLERLDLVSAYVTSLPSSLGDLKSLKHLDLSYIPNLTSLPNSLGDLKSLKHLKLSSIPNLKADAVPDALFDLPNLEVLSCASTNQQLSTRVARNAWRLNNLRELDLDEEFYRSEDSQELLCDLLRQNPRLQSVGHFWEARVWLTFLYGDVAPEWKRLVTILAQNRARTRLLSASDTAALWPRIFERAHLAVADVPGFIFPENLTPIHRDAIFQFLVEFGANLLG